jgi:hypothetical protein
MAERRRVDQIQPGSTFQLIADGWVDGTDEVVPTTDVLTAFDVTPDGTLIRIRTEVGTLSLEVEDYVDVVAPPA